MKAITFDGYGPIDGVRLAEIDKPVPGADEVLIEVRAASINPWDWHQVTGLPRLQRLESGTIGAARDARQTEQPQAVFGHCRGRQLRLLLGVVHEGVGGLREG